MLRIGRSIPPVEAALEPVRNEREGPVSASIGVEGFDRQPPGADCAEYAQECAHIRWETLVMLSDRYTEDEVRRFTPSVLRATFVDALEQLLPCHELGVA